MTKILGTVEVEELARAPTSAHSNPTVLRSPHTEPKQFARQAEADYLQEEVHSPNERAQTTSVSPVLHYDEDDQESPPRGSATPPLAQPRRTSPELDLKHATPVLSDRENDLRRRRALLARQEPITRAADPLTRNYALDLGRK